MVIRLKQLIFQFNSTKGLGDRDDIRNTFSSFKNVGFAYFIHLLSTVLSAKNHHDKAIISLREGFLPQGRYQLGNFTEMQYTASKI